jgi:FtsZ-binding cell division protein ZapB
MTNYDTLFGKCVQLENMKKSISKMQREHEKKYHFTVDAVVTLSNYINTAKAENAILLTEIQAGKHKFDQLRHEMEQLKYKFVTCQKELRSLTTEREVRDSTKELLDYTEKRCDELAKINQKLHVTLLKQNIKPDKNVKELQNVNKQRTKKSSTVRKQRPINAVSIRQKLSLQKISWK